MEEEELINIDDSPQAKLKLNAYLQNNGKLKEVDPKYNKIKLSTSQYLHNTSIGKSKYDKNLNFGDLDQQDIEKSINENRANEQSGWTQLGALPFRGINKAATEVAKLAPIIYGVGKAIFEDNETSALEDIFNNEGIKALDEMNQKINTEYLPVYVKESVKNGTLMDNLLSTSFYATEGADGIGFMASMFVPGMILSKFALGSKLIGGLSKVSKLTKMVEGTEGSIQVLKGLGWSGRAIDSKIAVLTNSMIEAGAESKGTQDALNGERLNEIELYKSKGLSQEQAEEVFNQKHPDWDNQVASAMKGDFWLQMPMLLGTGSMMHKAIFGKALDKVEKTVEYGLKGRVGSMAKQWGKATLSEGFIEEAVQSTLENYYTKKAYEGKLGKGLIGDVNIGDLTKEYINTVSSVEGGKAIFLGALMGGPFMSMEARREHLKGLKDTNSITNGVKSSIDDYNTIKENDIYELNEKGTPIYQRDEKGRFTGKKIINREKALEVAKSLKNIEDDDALYDEAIKSDDIELQKFIQNRNILKLIAPAIQNGKLGLQILKEELEQTLKFTDISEADKSSKDEKNTNKKLVENILEKAKHLQEQNEKFKDFSPDIIKLDDPRTTKELNEEYLNHLNSKYIETKSLQYDAENNLKELNKKRNNILDELGLDKDLQIEDEVATKKEESSSLLKQVGDKIRETEKEVSKYKKDVNEIWENKDLINKSFKSYINNKEKSQKQTSEEKIQQVDEIINNIKSINNKEELLKYYKNLPQDIRENHYIGEVVQDQHKFITELEEIQKQIDKVEALEKDKEKFENDAIIGTETKSETKETVTEPISNIQLESIQTSDNAEVDNENNEIDLNPEKIVQLNERTNPLNASKNQGASRIISTNQQTGEPLFDKLKDFVEYEKEPRDKTKDKVTFDLGDINPKDLSFTANAIFERLKNGENITEDETKYLENYLPIKVTLSNGNKSAFSFIDSMNSKSKEIVEVETLPLRKAIIKALIENKGKFEGIEGKVNKQFTGVLQLGEQNSNILDLDVFKDMSEEDKIKYFKKNTVYVSNKGEVKYTSNNVLDETKSLSSENKGEVFLKIPMINGEMFYLKLNVSRLTQEKAESVLDLIILRSNILNKSQELTSEELEEYVNNNLPNLKTELEFIKRNNDSIDVTLERLINFIVYSQNTNAKTKLILGQDGTLALGELLHKVNSQIPEWSGQLESYTYTTESLNNLNNNQKQAIIEYLKYKRHNVLITKDNSATFNNDDYIKYLLGISSDYSVLTTNAIVNEPTFQGYSNIYLNQSVSNKNAKKTEVAENTKEINFDSSEDLLASLNFGDDVVKTIQTETNPQSDLEAKKADIERRRQERRGDALEKIGVSRVGYDGKQRQDWKDAKNQDLKIATNHAIERLSKNPNVKIGSLPSSYSNAIKAELEIRGVNSNDKTPISEIIEKLKKINAKYDAELKSLEGENNSEPIKLVKSDKLQDIFKTSDAKTQAKIVMVIAKQLGMTDKVNPKDMTSSFNELFKELKDNETLQKEIKKICGL